MEDQKKQNKLSLVQPNKVTNARHDFDERQENILTMMIDAIQKHMTKELSIHTDLFGSPMIRIDTKEVGAKNKSHYLKSAKGMTEKTFEFEWTNPEGLKVDSYGIIVTTVHNIKETPYIDITINQWAIPYLLYWGKGVGGTVFNKSIALVLRGEYTKRLYKLCKRWEDRGGFTMSLDEFRSMMHLENKYSSPKDLKKRVLNPSIERMKLKADVYFKCAFEKIGGSRSYNQINFVVIPNQKNKPNRNEKTEMYSLCYNMITIAFPSTKSSKAMDVCDKIADDPDKFEQLYFRMKNLKNELDDGRKSIKDAIPLIKYILKEDYNIK